MTEERDLDTILHFQFRTQIFIFIKLTIVFLFLIKFNFKKSLFTHSHFYVYLVYMYITFKVDVCYVPSPFQQAQTFNNLTFSFNKSVDFIARLIYYIPSTVVEAIMKVKNIVMVSLCTIQFY